MRKVRKFVALVLLVAGAAGIALWTKSTLFERSRPVREAMDRDFVRLSSAFAASLGNSIESTTRQATGLAESIGPWTGARDVLEMRSLLDRLLRGSDLLDGGAYVVDRTGRVLAASSGNAGMVGLDRGGPHITAALGGSVTASPILIEPLSRRPVIAVAAPLQSRGDVTAVLVAMTAVDGNLANLLASYEAGPSAMTYIIDPAGTVLDDRTLSGDLHQAGPDSAPGADRARQTQLTGLLRHRGEGSIERISAYAHAGSGWSVVVTQPAADFYRAIDLTVLTGTLIAGVLYVALLLVSAFLISKWRRSVRHAEMDKKAFLAVAGHELRTPLTVIRGFGQTLLSKWDKMEDRQRKDIIQTIALQSKNLEHLVERLMIASQLDAGTIGLPSIRSMDIVPIVSKSVEHHQSLSVIHNLVLETPDAAWAEIDAKYFQQAIDHLLENAIKFSPSGGEIRVVVSRNRKSIHTSVADEGVGLPADSGGLFEKFSQSERVETRTHEEGGVGLGLYIVRSLMQRMGGSVEARPRKSGGARFVLRVPAGPNPR